MANTTPAKKRGRQPQGRRKPNACLRSAMRTPIKTNIADVDAIEYGEATAAYVAVVPVLDRAVTHGIIHRNKAARHKSRLNTAVKALKA